MLLTAQDIQSQQFHVRFRGFDVDEVDSFLEKISSAFQTVSEENQQLKGRLENLEKELTTYHNQQKPFQNAIIAAQNVVDGMKAKSKEEAEAIVAVAQEEARLRREDANHEMAELKNKIDDLKSLREQAREDMRQQLQSYLHMLETEPVDTVRAMEHFSYSPHPPQEPQRNMYGGSTPRSRATTTPETAPLSENTSPAASDETDLTDLYVKINIPDFDAESLDAEGKDNFSAPDIALPSSLASRKELLIMDEDEAADPILPDLDGDMAFNLEDPLEGHEPAVSFAENLENAKGNKTGRFNPDESHL